MNKQQVFSCRIPTAIVRFIISYGIYYSLFFDPGLNNKICGSFAIPIDSSFFSIVIGIQFIRIFYPVLSFLTQIIYPNYSFQAKIPKLYAVKYIIIFLFKLLIITGQYHRLKYYAHTALIQLVIMILCAVFDFSTYNISQVWQIVITDSLNRIAIVYEISRTFCPNFAIYWFFTNFIVLGMSQIQAHNINPNKIRNQVTYKESLYVKQDIYRIMILGFIYFGLFSALQINVYGWGLMITFLILCIPYWKAITQFNKGSIKISILLLAITAVIIFAFIKTRVEYPKLFKELGKHTCRPYRPLYGF